MGGKKVPGDFGAGSWHEQFWVAPGIADAKQPDSRRPSSAGGSFGLSGSSRFGDDDPPTRRRPPSRASAATISGITLDASPATPKAAKPQYKPVLYLCSGPVNRPDGLAAHLAAMGSDTD